MFNHCQNLTFIHLFVAAFVSNTNSRRKYYCYHENAKNGTLSKWSFFLYFDSNIGIFSIAPRLVIALPTLLLQKLAILISLLQFLCKFCILFHHIFFSVLIPYSWKSNNFRERAIK